MSDDITSALRGFAESQRRDAAATAPDAAVESGALSRRVTRRRAVRTGSMALTAVAVVGGVVVGTLLTGSRTPVQPATPLPTSTSTSTTTPTPPPTAAPTTTPTPDPIPPATPTVYQFAAAEPMAPGMLDESGPGWSVVRYETFDEGWNASAALYLLDPDGRPFLVPSAVDPDEWYLLDWLPGSSLVVAKSVMGTDARVLDLLTGEAREPFGSPTWFARFVGDGSTDVVLSTEGPTQRVQRVSADGEVRAETPASRTPYGSDTALWSPDRTRIVVNDLAGPRAITLSDFAPVTLPSPYPDRPDACRAWMWVDDADVLMECTVGGAGALVAYASSSSELWLVPVAAGAPRPLVGMPSAGDLDGVWRVDGRLVAGTSEFTGRAEEFRWWEVTDDGAVPLSTSGYEQEIEVIDVRGPELIAVREPFADVGGPVVRSLVAIDPLRGATRVIVDGSPAWNSAIHLEPRRYGRSPSTVLRD